MALIGANGSLIVRPPAGECWLINTIASTKLTGSAPNKMPDVSLNYMDASGISPPLIIDNASQLPFNGNLKIIVSHDYWITITNKDTGTQTLAYLGVQWK